MKLSLILPDSAYRSLLDGSLLSGSLSLVAPGEAFFALRKAEEGHQPLCFKQLSHGKVSISPACIRLELFLDRSESDCVPEDVLYEDCVQAQDFVRANRFDW